MVSESKPGLIVRQFIDFDYLECGAKIGTAARTSRAQVPKWHFPASPSPIPLESIEISINDSCTRQVSSGELNEGRRVRRVAVGPAKEIQWRQINWVSA
jgi:hypothetical protein